MFQKENQQEWLENGFFFFCTQNARVQSFCKEWRTSMRRTPTIRTLLLLIAWQAKLTHRPIYDPSVPRMLKKTFLINNLMYGPIRTVPGNFGKRCKCWEGTSMWVEMSLLYCVVFVISKWPGGYVDVRFSCMSVRHVPMFNFFRIICCTL